MFGTVPEPEGITNPPIDDLLEKVESKYALAVYGAQRARQINSYRQEMTRGDGNISTFADYLRDFSKDTQFVVVTHRKGTMERCDGLYGVAMEEKGVSKMLSVELKDVSAEAME